MLISVVADTLVELIFHICFKFSFWLSTLLVTFGYAGQFPKFCLYFIVGAEKKGLEIEMSFVISKISCLSRQNQ